MMTDDSKALLHRYSSGRSEEAFRDLVRKHSSLVYGTALRKLAGDQAAAQDVMQEVFSLLARKASRLDGVVMSGWLYRQTCRRAANHVRAENRRRQREKIAMESMTSPAEGPATPDLSRELDDAMLKLPAADRDALVLRFFDENDYQTVGKSLGITEEAARKRVRRALERLGETFKRKGIAIGGGLLESTMSGLGSTPVPTALISQVTANALKSAPALGAAGMLSLFKPIVAGFVVASIAAGSTLAIQQNKTRSSNAESASLTNPASRKLTDRADSGILPADASLESIIAEIKRVQGGPRNALTALRLDAALDRIEVGRIGEFIALANSRLSSAEKAAAYTPLLNRWLKVDPASAMDCVLLDKVGAQIDGTTGTNLLNNLFDDWVARDLASGQAWLLRHWKDETLAASAFEGSLRNFLSMRVAGKLFDEQGGSALSAFIQSIPEESDRKAAFKGLVGLSPWHNGMKYSNNAKRIELYQLLKDFPGAELRQEITLPFVTHWAEESQADFAAAVSSMGPADRFDMALGHLGVGYLPGERTPSLTGGYTEKRVPVSDRDAREAAAIQAGLDAGFTREQVLSDVGRVYQGTLSASEFFKWFDIHENEVRMDNLLAARARSEAIRTSWSGDEHPEMVAIQWALRIADEDLRRRLCRGAYRKLAASKPDAAAAYLKRPEAPPDLLDECRSILEESP
jgi:RNA polymerase sigma factor (sigma-70 family)